jgi:hypothetical protein
MPAKAGIHAPANRKEARMFFFEKKKQKTFAPAGPGTSLAKAPRSESFLAARRPGSVFSKNEDPSFQPF